LAKSLLYKKNHTGVYNNRKVREGHKGHAQRLPGAKFSAEIFPSPFAYFEYFAVRNRSPAYTS